MREEKLICAWDIGMPQRMKAAYSFALFRENPFVSENNVTSVWKGKK